MESETTTTARPLFGDTSELAAWRLFLRAYRRVIDRLEDELQDERSLSLAWYDVLIQLYRAPDHRLRMNDLACSVMLSKSGLTRLIDRMVKAGLVERASCPSDRRGSFAVLTPRGEETFLQAAPVHLEGITSHFGGHLTEAEAQAMARAFTKIVAALEEAGPPAGSSDKD